MDNKLIYSIGWSPLGDCDSTPVENSSKKGYLNNPFKVEGIVIKTRNFKGKIFKFIDPETGEEVISEQVSKHRLMPSDTKSYAKAFIEARDVIKTLTNYSLRSFLYITYHVAINSDTIYLNADDICGWCGYVRSTFYRSINELIEKKIIARKLGSYLEFFINPNILYNGDRVKLFTKNKQFLNKFAIQNQSLNSLS